MVHFVKVSLFFDTRREVPNLVSERLPFVVGQGSAFVGGVVVVAVR
jgi:hypothetical protein